MKLVILAIFALLTSACSILQPISPKEIYYEWDTAGMDTVKLDQMRTALKDCKDFAYRSKVRGAKYTEDDIQMSCMNRQGYHLNRYVVGE